MICAQDQSVSRIIGPMSYLWADVSCVEQTRNCKVTYGASRSIPLKYLEFESLLARTGINLSTCILLVIDQEKWHAVGLCYNYRRRIIAKRDEERLGFVIP